MKNRERALKSKRYRNKASKEVILRKLRPLFPTLRDEVLLENWKRHMDIISVLVCEGYGVSLAGIHHSPGTLHPTVKAARVVGNLKKEDEPFKIDPRVTIKMSCNRDFIKEMNKEYYSDLPQVRPDLYEDTE